MNRQHARPMSAHQRAQRIRGAAYLGIEAATFAQVLVAILAAVVVLWSATP